MDDVRVLALFGGNRLFGQERGNIEALRNMAAMGAKVRVVTTSRGNASELQAELDRQGLEWTTAPFGYTWHNYLYGRHFYYLFLNLYSILAVSWRILEEARQWKPTHLYTMNWNYFIYAWPALWILNVPLIWRAGDVPSKHSRLHRWMTRRICKRVDQMACISRFIRRKWEAVGMSPAKMQVIHNYPPQRVKMGPVKFHIAEGVKCIVYLGQVSAEKGVFVLLEAVKKLLSKRTDIMLVIAGEPSWGDVEQQLLMNKIAAGGLADRIRLPGFVENVVSLLAKAYIHVCPSMCNEALGNVVLEAKQEGVPSVVFPDGGLPELVEHKVDGYICRDCSVEALVEGLGYFLDRPQEHRRAGDAARKSLEEKFGLERFRKQWAEVFLKTSQNKHE